MPSGAVVLWWEAAVCLVIAAVSTGIGVYFSLKPVVRPELNPDTGKVIPNSIRFGVSYRDRAGMGLGLGAGLLFTLLAGAFALLTAPPWA